MIIQVEIDVFDDPEKCGQMIGGELARECKYYYMDHLSKRGHWSENFCQIYKETIGFIKKCDQCKAVYQKAKEIEYQKISE